MSAILTSILALLVDITGAVNSASTVAKIIAVLVDLIPVIVKEVQDVAPAVRNIINALSSNPATTTDQIAELDALSAKVDAAFEDAAKAAEAEDAAADAAGANPAPGT